MTLDRWFRLFSFLTLGLSCVALVSAEELFLPSLQYCLGPVLALLLVSGWVEGRWSLPVWAVNVLGLLIAGGGLCWLATQLLDENSFLSHVPLHLGLLPYMGPLVMAALLVTAFRPRMPGDFWRMQGLGLMQIGLGCVLADGPEFGSLFTAYLASGLACLALHYRRAAGGDRAVPAERSTAWWLLPFTLRWSILVGLLALPLFLLTPRHEDTLWIKPGRDRSGSSNPSLLQTGLSEGINLNGTGKIELDDEVAFQVAATDDAGRPRLDLPADQRWRGMVLEIYEEGQWRTSRPMQSSRRLDLSSVMLPDFGPGQFYLTYTVQPRHSGGLVLAEPIRLGKLPSRLPVVPVGGRHSQSLFFEVPGTVLPMPFSLRQEYHYRQVLPNPADSARTPAEGISKHGPYLDRLTRQPNRLHSRLQQWTVELLRRLARQSRYPLPDEVRTVLDKPWGSFLIAPEQWEAVARVLTDYLANSGEFTYSLELTREDRSLDPVLDFLIHLKRGHCERFATALALMLRSVGVPARLVKGYRGADNLGDGTFAVRHYHAHAWVEILVPHPTKGFPELDWLTLDPTPAAAAGFSSRFSLAHWWQAMRQGGRQLWQAMIADYNAEEQSSLWSSLMEPGNRLPALLKLVLFVLLAFASFLILLLLRRRLRRRVASRPPITVAFYHRLVQLLARHMPSRPNPGRTPREFGAAAHPVLVAVPGLSALAELPARVVELFYRVRYGRLPLSDPETRALDAELDRLAQELAAHPPDRFHKRHGL